MRATYPKVGYYLGWISVPRLRLPNSGAPPGAARNGVLPAYAVRPRPARLAGPPADSRSARNGTIVSLWGKH